jgi:hypothetical protein
MTGDWKRWKWPQYSRTHEAEEHVWELACHILDFVGKGSVGDVLDIL